MMNKGDQSDPLRDLDTRLKQAQSRQHPEKTADSSATRADMRGLGYAFRVGTELVSALVVGLGVGYGLDYWLDTKPWFMIVFFFIGSGAGILNVYRASTGIGMAPGYRAPDESAGDNEGSSVEGEK